MKRDYKFRVLVVLPVFMALAACGGGGSDGGSNGGSNGGGNGGFPGGGSTWQTGVFQPSATFDAKCVSPRSGTADRAGTVTDQNNWLRSWTNELYLWYSEVPDLNPANYTTDAYFRLLKTAATTTSGAAKDKFHFVYDTDDWEALSQGGTEAGYGAEFAILAPYPPRRIVVAYTDPGTTAETNLNRGDEILQVDGADAVNGNTQAIADALNAGLFPDNTGESHTFVVRNTAGVSRTVTMASATITHTPVPIYTTFPSDSGPVGYIQFNDHIATAERPLITAINTLKTANVKDLILDVRYNGGGYLDLASELAYMIGNTSLISGKTFEKIVFNDKNPSRNPVTGESLVPTPFHSTSGFQAPLNDPLPTLNLTRVYVITGPGTCSASESIINSLRGAGVEVFIIGSTTCGKPYGFYPTDNCGTTYFTIQFRGENNANFGDYTDGFSPANTTHNVGTVVPGCSVADDFTHEMGDAAESRIAAALSFRASNNLTCPTPATGVSSPQLAKASIFDGAERQSLAVSKPMARQNRIIRRMQ